MDIFSAILFGIVEGITEFLPISSTGHLMLLREFLNIPPTDTVKTFEIAIQLGAILAVLFVYPKKLIQEGAVTLRVLLAFIPTAILGVIFYPFIKSFLFEHIIIVPISLFLGGIVLIVFERYTPTHTTTIEALPFSRTILIGLCQTLAFIPGVSRSGASIVSSMFLGLEKRSAVEFSFLLAIPTMFAAVGYDLVNHIGKFTQADIFVLGVGCLTSFAVAYAAIRFLLSYIVSHSFFWFGIYRILAAIILLLVIV